MQRVDVAVIVDEAARRLAIKAGKSWLDTLENEREQFRDEVLAAGLFVEKQPGNERAAWPGW